ncbi:odorant receptor 33c [Drosophila pseudoobscura]|uniref:Odorant receptor n=1 Tax=Drosophila pseudoobscura pseudoobscura TaxID=46245 RepID=A0A6I8UKT9_DROPS|nr:odorant receptor 33c [Drosophila pseudoobscura]
MAAVIDSVRVYQPFWWCMRLMAPTFFGATQRPVQIYVGLLHLLVTFLFPVHLLVNLAMQPTSAELFQNLSISMTCAACSLKHVAHLYHLQEIAEIQKLLIELDGYVDSEEEHRYYVDHLQCQARRFTRCLYASFVVIYVLFLLNLMILIASEDRMLVYPAYFPFDWQGNGYLYAIALGYQSICLVLEGIQGVSNDTFSPLTLCFLGGHIHMWGLRMRKLGYEEEDEESPSVNHHQQLWNYIEQHKILMRLHRLTRHTVSLAQLVQLGCSGASLCIIVCYLLFFVRDIITLLYYMIFIAVICVQLFPACYFASVVAEEMQSFPYAIFSSKWYEESREHRRDLLIFTQLTLVGRSRVIKAGGLIELNLNAFFVTLKTAYSLFALVVQVKDI